MEPMALGSPSSSPAPSSPTSLGFLPSFLMGEAQQSTPGQTHKSVSPVHNRLSDNFRISSAAAAEPKTLRQKLFSNSMNTSFTSPTHNVTPSTDKSGPPKQSLFDTMEHKRVETPCPNNTIPYLSDCMPTPTEKSFARTEQPILSPNSSTVNDESFNTFDKSFRGYRKESLWVTVFGFPPSALSLVLAHFAVCGVIVDKKSPTQGNWAHIKYSNMHEVSKALSFNGKLITTGIMVGVMPYYKGSENKENTTVISSPIRARSLRHSFVSPQSTCLNTSQNVPQKSTGLVTKAMEYVFGW